MAKKKSTQAGRRLGRGLGSLMNTSVPVQEEAPAASTSSEAAPSKKEAGFVPTKITGQEAPTAGLQHLPVGSIVANPRQPRQRFDDETLEQLASSIRQSGVMQPIVVRPAAKGFELVAGERRLRACQQIGQKTIPAVVQSLSDRDAAEWALVENLQREDLRPLERAEGIARLMDEFAMTQAEAGKQLALDRTTITNLLRLRELDPGTLDALDAGLITQGHARALLGCRDLARRESLLKLCVRKSWSVREVERQVKQEGSSPRVPGAPRSSHVTDLESRLAAHLGTKVKISLGRKKGSGRMSLEFYSLEQFDGLLDRLGFVAEDAL